MKYYAVIDTNVLVSAALKWKSVPGSIYPHSDRCFSYARFSSSQVRSLEIDGSGLFGYNTKTYLEDTRILRKTRRVLVAPDGFCLYQSPQVTSS